MQKLFGLLNGPLCAYLEIMRSWGNQHPCHVWKWSEKITDRRALAGLVCPDTRPPADDNTPGPWWAVKKQSRGSCTSIAFIIVIWNLTGNTHTHKYHGANHGDNPSTCKGLESSLHSKKAYGIFTCLSSIQHNWATGHQLNPN